MSARALRRCLAAAAGAAVLLALPTAAGAHVEATGTTADGTTTVEFSFHHGCDGAATTGLRIQLPEGATDVEPQDPEGWTSTVSGDELAWTGGSVPDHEEAAFVATMTLADPEGTTVYLPTIQQCGSAQEDWIDRSDDPESANAAPRITAGPVVIAVKPDPGAEDTVPERTTNAEGAAPSTTTPATTTTSTSEAGSSEEAAPATQNASSTSSSSTPIIVGAVVAVVVLAGIAAFVVSRRGSSPS